MPTPSLAPAFALLVALVLPTLASAQNPRGVAPEHLSGLTAAAEIVRDVDGIAHIRAANEHDLFFLQGYVHAEDRLFQMDLSRRRASGTLAEVLGPGAMESDVQLRTLGLRRAAEGSWAIASARARAAVSAYTAGVNAWIRTHPLPPEYGPLELTQVAPWTELDTLAVANSIAFSLSFGLEDLESTVALLTYQGVLDAFLGAGAGRRLYAEDLYRAQPFTSASTVPDASVDDGTSRRPPFRPMRLTARGRGAAAGPSRGESPSSGAPVDVSPIVRDLARRYLDSASRIPLLRERLDRANRPGSNQWAVSGRHTTTGRPLVANDPHLALGTPSTFYPIHLAAATYDVMGSGFAGVPFVIVGQNRWIAWGATVNPIDVTDIYQEQVVPDALGRLYTVFQGALEPVTIIPEVFRYNNVGNGVPDDRTVVTPGSTVGGTLVPPATLVVPRRNNGPIISLDQATGVALSVQFTGFSPTRLLETFLIWNTAKTLDDFLHGLQYFDVGGQNFAYADVAGNIAYVTSSEIPIREDLQAGAVVGLPPWFVRNGQGGNEWLPVANPQPGQAIPYEILPFSEMPHVINPPAGWFVNANNDPAGTNLDNDPLNTLRPGGGIYYLNRIYDAGFRGGRITDVIRGRLATGERLSFEDMQAIQADVVLLDATFFVPFIQAAFTRAQGGTGHPLLTAFSLDPRLQEAVARLAGWDFTSPTGVLEGYDAADVRGDRADPADAEIAASVATTLYSVWRGQFIRHTIDATLDGVSAMAGVTLPRPPGQLPVTALRNLLEQFPVAQGVGASGLNFFNVPGVASAEDRRDILILKSLADSLDRLAGPAFGPAFGGSADQGDYRWGRLHRLVMSHPLGGPFNLPGAMFPPSFSDLPGFATDGGLGAVDASNHDVRADTASRFTFANGPVNRFVAEGEPQGMRAESVWPGGTSGVLGSPYYANMLPLWLTNDTIPLRYRRSDLNGATASVQKFVPGRPR
ncbi:MAG: penicillin acylase family protein [Acidobacteria bacterium]|nr:penicillin acylase family protein [Acidobacteriota bacterium]